MVSIDKSIDRSKEVMTVYLIYSKGLRQNCWSLSDLTANNVKTGAEKSSLRTFPWFYARLTCKALSVNQEILGCNGFQELCGESPPS